MQSTRPTRCPTCNHRVLRLRDWQERLVVLDPNPTPRGQWAIKPLMLGGGEYADCARAPDTTRYQRHECKPRWLQ